MRKIYLFLFVLFCLFYLFLVFFGVFPVSYFFGRWGARGDGVVFVMLAPLLAVFLLFANYYFKSDPVVKKPSKEELDLYFHRSSAPYEQAVYDDEGEDILESQVNDGGWENLKYTVPGIELYFKDQEQLQSDRKTSDDNSPLINDKRQ